MFYNLKLVLIISAKIHLSSTGNRQRSYSAMSITFLSFGGTSTRRSVITSFGCLESSCSTAHPREVKYYCTGSTRTLQRATALRWSQLVQWTPIMISSSQPQSIICTQNDSWSANDHQNQIGEDQQHDWRDRQHKLATAHPHHGDPASAFRHLIRDDQGDPEQLPTVENNQAGKRQGMDDSTY